MKADIGTNVETCDELYHLLPVLVMDIVIKHLIECWENLLNASEILQLIRMNPTTFKIPLTFNLHFTYM